jgi:hypothetical protein
MSLEFKQFPKIKRLFRDTVITEKLDGTNASIYIGEDGTFLCGSRTRWITPQDDNYGFAKWAHDNKEELLRLGTGHHFGEWWGQGIQRNYGLRERRFSLFNTSKWSDPEARPNCCYVVPILWQGMFDTDAVYTWMEQLKEMGSAAVPGYMNPEGVVVYHTHANICFKYTLDNDDEHKGK